MIGRLIGILLCAVVLCGGAMPGMAQKQTAAEIEKYGVYPIAYRELIERWLGEQLIDPASAQIEWLSEPQKVVVKKKGEPAFAGFMVDFKVNSRNKFGMYTGKQARRVFIRNGQVVSGGRIPK